MIDFGWDFNLNDFVEIAGDFEIITTCSMQNGEFIFRKSAASLSDPSLGIGFEEFYPHLPKSEYNTVAAEGEKQMIRDGAQYARVVVRDITNDPEITSTGDAEYDINVRYRE